MNYPPPLNTPRDLCSYVRAVIRGIIVASLMAIAGGWLIASSIVVPIISLCHGFGILPQTFFSFVGFTVVWVMIGMIIYGIVHIRIRELIYKYRGNRSVEDETKQPNLFVARYRAWKAKICPFVEYI